MAVKGVELKFPNMLKIRVTLTLRLGHAVGRMGRTKSGNAKKLIVRRGWLLSGRRSKRQRGVN